MEKGFTKPFHTLKAKADRLIEPQLKFLIRIRISPEQVTALALFSGLFACPAMLYSRFAALLLLYTHVYLGLIDKRLGDYAGISHAKSELFRKVSELTIITVTIFSLLHIGHLGIFSSVIFLLTYILSFIFILRYKDGLQAIWLDLPRYAVYAWLLVEFYIWRGSLDYIIWLLSALLIVKIAAIAAKQGKN